LVDFLGDLLNDDSQIDEATVVGTTVALLVAGTTTSTNALCYVSYELARNPEIQKRLRKEIQNNFQNINEATNYEKLMQLQYLDMVINEALRRHPPVPVVSRGCSKDYNFKEGQCIIRKDDEIQIPLAAIMMDNRYVLTNKYHNYMKVSHFRFYNEPHKFNPENFSNEAKLRNDPFTFIPFGHGPRNCIGKQLALLKIKMVLAKVQ